MKKSEYNNMMVMPSFDSRKISDKTYGSLKYSNNLVAVE